MASTSTTHSDETNKDDAVVAPTTLNKEAELDLEVYNRIMELQETSHEMISANSKFPPVVVTARSIMSDLKDDAFMRIYKTKLKTPELVQALFKTILETIQRELKPYFIKKAGQLRRLHTHDITGKFEFHPLMLDFWRIKVQETLFPDIASGDGMQALYDRVWDAAVEEHDWLGRRKRSLGVVIKELFKAVALCYSAVPSLEFSAFEDAVPFDADRHDMLKFISRTRMPSDATCLVVLPPIVYKGTKKPVACGFVRINMPPSDD